MQCMYYTVIQCHKLVFLVLVRLIANNCDLIARLIAIKIFNRIKALKISFPAPLRRDITDKCLDVIGVFNDV